MSKISVTNRFSSSLRVNRKITLLTISDNAVKAIKSALDFLLLATKSS